MILITNRAQEVAEWIEANCSEPSRYSTSEPWAEQVNGRSLRPPGTEIAITLSAVDQLLFDLYFAGWFIKHSRHDRWYDATELNRMMIELIAAND